ncbi:MAG TPA: BPSS1780 family membrane protein [Pseudomonadales bacterium]
MNDKKTEHEKMLDELMPNRSGPVELQVWPAAAGALWVRQGFALFRQAPGRWLAGLAILALSMMAVSVLPVVGDILGPLLGPVFNAGLMFYASKLASGRDARAGDLFIGLRERTAALVGVGGISLLVMFLLLVLLAMMAATSLGEEPLKALVAALQAEDMDAMKAIVMPHSDALLLDALIAIALYLPFAAAMWFAPALILLNQCAVLTALRLSLQACIRNFMPMLVYSLVLMGWVALGGIVFTLLAAVSPVFASVVMVLLAIVFGGLLVAVQWVSFAAMFPQSNGQPPRTDGKMEMLL